MRNPDAVLKSLVETLVDHDDQVRVECTESQAAAVIDVFVHKDDVGIVLGRSGSNAEALRTIFKSIYGKLGKRLYLQIEQLPRD